MFRCGKAQYHIQHRKDNNIGLETCRSICFIFPFNFLNKMKKGNIRVLKIYKIN